MLGKLAYGLAMSACVFLGKPAFAEGPHAAGGEPGRPRAGAEAPLEEQFRTLLRLRDADSYHSRMRADRDLRALLAANFVDGTHLLARLRVGASLEVSRALDRIHGDSEVSWSNVRMEIQERLAGTPEGIQAHAAATGIVDRLLGSEAALAALNTEYQRLANDIHVQRRLVMYPNGVFNENYERAPTVVKAKLRAKEAGARLMAGLRGVVEAAGFRVENARLSELGAMTAVITCDGRRFNAEVGAHSASVGRVGNARIPLRTLLSPLQLARLGARSLEDIEVAAPTIRETAYRDPSHEIMTRTTTANVDARSRTRIIERLRAQLPRQHADTLANEIERANPTDTGYPGLTFAVYGRPHSIE